ncbi:MAG: patatin-like phospholipase family protein [Steroidobacteraceae bacterium]|jgi:predicted acylesterase/phospholipase RssA|nr:patatin-like phospholipase family protein [Steroidobacteraceae bacterium]
MLTLQPATRPRSRSRAKIGLALAGGGPLGAFYELGALHALAESVEGLDVTSLDVYVGVSSGAIVAAGLVNGFDPLDMGVLFIDNAADEYPMTPGLFLQPAFDEYARRMLGAPGLLLEIAKQYLSAPWRGNWAQSLEPLGRLLPTGLFDNRPYERFLAHMFESAGRSNDFRRLPHRLYVVATDLDGGTAARFGGPGLDDVPVSRAIQASTALPGLYPPVEIRGHTYVDGALMRTMHASLALEEGADFVICVNPLVAYDAYAHGGRTRVEAGGFPLVMSQTFRALIQSRMLVGMAAYRHSHPHADMILFEPDRSDEQMFFVNMFKYSDRRRLVEHSYQRTRADLRRRDARLRPLLARHGLRLRHDVLADEDRTYQAAVKERRRHYQPVTGRLHATLDRLAARLAVT